VIEMPASDETMHADAAGHEGAIGRFPDPTAAGQGFGEALLRLQAVNAQLQRALYSRIVIEQAKGVLAERYRVSMDEAFDVLRYAARTSRTNIHQFAQSVVRDDPSATDAVDASLSSPKRHRLPRAAESG
jgi:hypothetical protein